LAAIVAFGLMVVMQHGHDASANNYVLLADAWLHGRSWIAYPGERIDAVPFHGLAYIVEGPAPAVLLLPFVALYGTQTYQPLLANVLGAVIVFATWRLAERVGLALPVAASVTAFAFFGTSLYTCATVGDVWFVAHVSAFCFTLLAIAECTGRGRAWLVAVYALLAAFSRFPLVTALPLYAVALWLRERRWRDVAAFVATLVPGFALSAWYDLVRWGTIGDPGFSIWYHVMDDRSRSGAPMFSVQNLSMQIATFVTSNPSLSNVYPFIVIGDHGFSLLWTSLPFLYAVAAPLTAWSALLWIATFATAIPAFTYYDTGQYQFGMRHALDFEAFVLALLIFALKRRPSRVASAALVVFALFGFYGGTVWLRLGS
jgi:hypothetical protein